MQPAEQLVGIVTAASQAIESWFALGDTRSVLESATGARRVAAEAPEVGREAIGLSEVVPASRLRIVSDRVARHWQAYERALSDELTKEQAQALHVALLTCMSRELESLRDLEPTLPPGAMKRWWLEYA